MREAVRDALNQAGAGADQFARTFIPESQTYQDSEADVVVIGAGGAGMTAAVKAAAQGKQVILKRRV